MSFRHIGTIINDDNAATLALAKANNGIRSSVDENQIFDIDNQAVEGFIITVFEDEEFGGRYAFTYTYDFESAHDLIFAGDALFYDNHKDVNV